MTRDELKAELKACAYVNGRQGVHRHSVTSRVIETVDAIEDDLLAEFNETMESESFVVFETKNQKRIVTFDVSDFNLSNASEFLQACIDEANSTADLREAMKMRRRATLYLSADDLLNRFTACANESYARLKTLKNDPTQRRLELALMHDTQAYLRFGESMATLPYEALESFNAMRARTGVAVFKSDEDDSLGPTRDEFLLRFAIRDFLPEDSAGNLSEVKDANQLLKFCIKAMREDFQNEFDRPPPKIVEDEVPATIPPPAQPRRKLTPQPGVTFGKRTAFAS